MHKRSCTTPTAAAAPPTTRRRLLRHGAVAVGSLLLLRPAAAQPLAKPAPGGFAELRWDDLVPKGWDAMKGLRDKGISNPAALIDGDPKTDALMAQLREAWDNAPTEPSLNGARVKLPGYLVPLEEGPAGLTEFLLVPYFGACIHTPPPPANQIVWVLSAKPAPGLRSMDTVWVSGTLRTTRGSSAMGSTGYRLDASLVERYKPTPR